MSKYAKRVVEQAKAWIGKKESDGSHKVIIDIYNGHKPLARGYKVKYTDSWCATFVSAVAIKLGYTDIIPTECSCQKMIELFKKLGCWIENENRTPNPGDIIFYDWQDFGGGDNTGWADHVGIVEKVSGSKITVIEGNLGDAVERRSITVNSRYIRGYAAPKYDVEPAVEVDYNAILEWQKAAMKDGFKFPKYGADGEWGSECTSVAKKAIVKRRIVLGIAIYSYPNLTKIVQKAVGVEVDGKCGKDTRKAIIAYQKKKGLTADGCVGLNTWKKILGV
ncbi:MAG: CHAP domain-containing protein [Lachnospiraceae bacterium]|nr:CHAP domain-containing protein [Lachnospiraceae bacterium]